MIRKLSYLFVALGFLGLLTLIPGSFDKASYIYFRIAGGKTIQMGGKCFEIPPGWVIDSRNGNADSKPIDLRKKIGSNYIFASIVNRPISDIPNYEDLVPIKEVAGQFSLYAMENLSSENTIRYWAVVASGDLILIGQSVDTLAELAEATFSGDCETNRL